jgi:hypothetical protein
VPARVSVFIGWSGPRSKAVALALKDWLPQVIQAATPWVSESMDRGAQWFATIGKHLMAAHYGLMCITPENARQQWVLFEAGALALRTSEQLACPYLLDLGPAELDGPLGQLQAATANKDGTWKVVETINRLLDDGTQLPGERLQKSFDTWWPELEAKLGEARQIATATAAVPSRSLEDKLDEVLEIVRLMQRSGGRSLFETNTAIPPYDPFGLTPPQFSPEVTRKVGQVLGLLSVIPPTQDDAQPHTVRHKIGKPKKPR